MDTESVVASLLSSFPQVPPAAVPAMLDCILASTNSSLSSLLSSLLNEFPNVTKDIASGSENMDSGRHYYVASYFRGLCHLLKKSGASVSAMELFIWTILVPLLKLVHASHLEMYNEAVSMFFDVVVETGSWDVVQATLVPFSFRLVGLSMGIIESEESENWQWISYMNLQVSCTQPSNKKCLQTLNGGQTDVNIESVLSQPDYFPLSVSCHLLTLALDAALQHTHLADCACRSVVANECSVAIFARNLLLDLYDLSFQMLSFGVEHRSSAINILLPSIFEVFALWSFGVPICGQKHVLSRKHLVDKIWTCCKKLFSLGLSERRDAYAILSLYLSSSSFSNKTKDGNTDGKGETFDLRSDKEFWDEIKRGLVDKQGLVRKQSLHILKTILNLGMESRSEPACQEVVSDGKNLAPRGMTKRERWADKEAKSLGVGWMYNFTDQSFNRQQKWGAFILLYEMLEEYGTHLVEAAWNHQMSLLLHSSFSLDNPVNSSDGEHQNPMETSEVICEWLAVLWERGFCHDNPQVRCLIMQSFLGIPWKDYGSYARLVPQEFILGPLMRALNDPVHHKDFGLKGVYSSRTIEAAANFLNHYSSYLHRKQIKFLSDLASLSKSHSFGRSGFMCLSECIVSTARGVQKRNKFKVEHDVSANIVQVNSSPENSKQNDKADLIDILRFIVESSKQHFNANYRFQVCEKILEAATSVMTAIDVPLGILLHFISSLPRDFTDFGGSLRCKVQDWLLMYDEKQTTLNCSNPSLELLSSLAGFPKNFVYCHLPVDGHVTYDDEDMDRWGCEAKRWARVIFLVVKEDHYLDAIFTFIRDHGFNLCDENNLLEWLRVKFLIIVSSLVQELQAIQERISEGTMKERMKPDLHPPRMSCPIYFMKGSTFLEKFSKLLLSILEELVSYAKLSCSIFWFNQVEEDSVFPDSIRGRLGGPSQRRLSRFTTTSVLQAITSLKSVASISRWCVQFQSDSDISLDSALSFLWNFCWEIIKSPLGKSETEAEIFLAAYEALAHVLKSLVPAFFTLSMLLVMEKNNLSESVADSEPVLDSFIQKFLQSVNNVIAVENLARSRRAILMNWKWISLESLLSVPKFVLENGIHMRSCNYFFSGGTVMCVFYDLVDSLENAGEVSVLSMLRSVRFIMELFASGRRGLVVSSCSSFTTQMMWDLVNPCWILHVSCNKRRVAPIAALLSSVLHYSVFGDERMHEYDDEPGPLKWFIEKILEEGTRSPRTTRLAALHLTGLWLRNPNILKYYMKELKLLTMYGSVAFDEDFEAELAENQDAKSELSVLAQSPDPELTEEFINTELYARVSVAVLFYKLADIADMVTSTKESENILAALSSGKMFLLELLQSAVNDKDLSKELYKKYSAIHRRKVRVLQMICILSRFIDEDILEEVTCSLHKGLQRNNLPSVRQYLETFAIHVYLKFPSLVGKQLVPLLQNYDIRPQALTSYVFVAANVILHADKAIQSRHLNELLPPIIPLLTSHHHTLRGFTQLLVHQVLQKLLYVWDSDVSVTMSLEKRCLGDLKAYLMCNPDCARLRASMEGYLDAFDPNISVTPAGIFTNRVEEFEFECVSKTLMDQVVTFLNDARDDLRCSIAKDAATIKHEGLQINDYINDTGIVVKPDEEKSFFHLSKDVTVDFQKKFTLSEHEMQSASDISMDKKQSFKSLAGIEKEDQLLDRLLHSRSVTVQKLGARRQQLIIVASLLDRIPNLAGLARTCEVFRAAGLAIADKNILSDKQFQLISVTAEKWVPIVEVPVSSMKVFLQKKKQEGFAILGLEQTANSIPLDKYLFPTKTVLVLGKEKEGIPVEIIHILDACVEIPQLGVVRSLNVHVSGAIAIWEYTRQQIAQ